jgi:hypothetical protein
MTGKTSGQAERPKSATDEGPSAARLFHPSLAAYLGLFLILVLPAIFFGINTEMAASDQFLGHIPQINFQIAHPFTLYNPATVAAQVPGYHIMLAWIAILFGYTEIDAGTLLLRLVNAAMGAGFLAVVWVVMRRLQADPWRMTALVLPLACSTYVISSAVWITTDDAALLCYALVLYSVMFHRRNSLLAGLTAALLVMVRHIFLPVVGVYALSLLQAPNRELRRDLASAAAAIIPSALIVGYFALLWGGLTPPRVQSFNAVTLNGSVPLHALALTGLFALAYAPTLLRSALAIDRRPLLFGAGTAAVVATVLWLVVASDYAPYPAERWGSLVWYVAHFAPTIAHRSLPILPLAALGAATLTAMVMHAHQGRYFPAATAMLLLYFVAYSGQYFAWQRYIEPPIMLTFAVFCARLERLGWVDLLGPLVLSAVFGTMSLLRLYGLVGQLFA